MLTPRTRSRRSALAVGCAILLAGVTAAGCDLQEDADLERGRALFQEQCGTCHALAEAGTAATVGPSLDSSFATARADGMDQDTIEGVVQAQIENPRTVREGVPNYDRIFMPANLVTGRDAEDVAAYVASVAGIPGIEPPPLGEPQEVFVEKCGSCHRLAEAGTSGTTGPDLDEALPGQDDRQVEESIRDPEAQISKVAFPSGGVMPPFDENQIPPEDLEKLIEYLLGAVGGGSGGGN